MKSLQSKGPSVSNGESDSMSDESRSIHIINHAKQAAALAAKNRELNKKMSKQRADEYYSKQK